MKVYITFGQCHTHRCNNQTFDCNSVAVIHCENYSAGRELAFLFFDDGKFHNCTEEIPKMEYFPRGLIEANND